MLGIHPGRANVYHMAFMDWEADSRDITFREVRQREVDGFQTFLEGRTSRQSDVLYTLWFKERAEETSTHL